MTRPTVVLTDPLFPEVTRKILETHYRVTIARTRTELKKKIKSADALVTLLTDPVDKDLLKQAKQLKVVGNYAVGLDNIDLNFCKSRGIRVVHTPKVLTRSTAELALTLLLAAARRLPEGEKECRTHRFSRWKPQYLLGKELKGRTAVIVGKGLIGKETAKLFRGLGIKILWITRTSSPDSIKQKLKKAQILSLHLPLNDRNHHWLDRKKLSLLPKDAIVINTARGAVVEEKALIEALRKKQIFSAGLDVYEYEPKIPRALTALKNVVLLPHLGSATEETRRIMTETVLKGVVSVLNGVRPWNEVRRFS